MPTATTKKHLFVATFGCQMNEYDSERMVDLLAGQDYDQTADITQADLILLNTCSIREKAEQKVYSFLGRLKALKKKKPHLIIGVSGCVAQQQGRRLLEDVPYLDLVVGTHSVSRLPEMVAEVVRAGRPVLNTDFFPGPPRPLPVLPQSGRIKAFLTVMQGCDNFCSYCVVPYVRGREVSRPPEEVLDEARALLASGVKEITLLGQNVNSYGQKPPGGLSFAGLIEQMAELPGLARLRFTTSHPKDLSPELIRALAEVPVLCEHIHLPVQAGSNRVLADMRRRYTREQYLDKIAALRAACPDLAVTTDVIVGFPGETETDFEDTLDLVRRVGYDGMYSFKYSDRPMTRAARMEQKLDEEVKGERLTRLQSLQRDIVLARHKEMVGREVEVLVEGTSKRTAGQLTGRTRTNKIVNFMGPERLIGSLVRVRIADGYANSLHGELPRESQAGLASIL